MRLGVTLLFLSALSVLTVNAQTDAAAEPHATAAPKLTTPEYSGVVYARNTDGTLTALPRARVKVGRVSVGVTLPAEIPTVTGPLVTKLEGSADPKSLLEIGCGRGFKKELAFEVKNLGDRIFELKPAPATGDCVVAFKAGGLGLPSDMFAFRVSGDAKK